MSVRREEKIDGLFTRSTMLPFDRLFVIMSKPLVAALYLGLVLLLILYFDKSVSSYLFHADLRSHFPLVNYLTKVGLGLFYFPTFLVLALFFRYLCRNRRWELRFWFLLLCITVPTIICLLLKMTLARARPNLFLKDIGEFYGFYWFKWDPNFWSFPSGHATTIMGVAFGLCILFPRYFAAFLSVGLTVALSRVLLTHHYLSDVLFTIYLTLIEIGCLLYCLRRKSCLAPAWKHRV